MALIYWLIAETVHLQARVLPTLFISGDRKSHVGEITGLQVIQKYVSVFLKSHRDHLEPYVWLEISWDQKGQLVVLDDFVSGMNPEGHMRRYRVKLTGKDTRIQFKANYPDGSIQMEFISIYFPDFKKLYQHFEIYQPQHKAPDLWTPREKRNHVE